MHFAPRTPHPPATPPGLPGAGTADVSQAPTGNVAHLATGRLAGQDGFDRLVLEFADRVPGYTVGYRPLPAHADASGAEIALPGALCYNSRSIRRRRRGGVVGRAATSAPR